MLVAIKALLKYLRTATNWIGKSGPAVLSIASFVLSIMALKVNERSMEVSQRAYVDVDNAQVHVGPVVSYPNAPSVRVIYCKMALKNTGNTPARFIQLQTKTTAPEGWNVIKTDEPRPGPVGPKSDRNWDFSQAVVLTSEAAAATIGEAEKVKSYHEYRATHYALPANLQPRPQVYIDFTLTYVDVFGQKETLNWRASEVL